MRLTLKMRNVIVGYSFAIPVLAGFLILIIGPMIFAFYLSVHKWGGLTPLSQASFVGLQQYTKLIFRDARFQNAFVNTLFFTVGAVVGQSGLGLLLALLLDRVKFMVGFYRAVFFMPVILSMAAMSLLWGEVLYSPSFGLFNEILRGLHLPTGGFILNRHQAMPSIIGMTVWKFGGYYMVIFLAGLQGIPQVYYEAANIDGASKWQQFLRITLPLLKPTILFVLVINTIGSLQVFTPVFLMTHGGPANATDVVVFYMYEAAFGFMKFSYAAAMATILFLVILGVSLLQIFVLRRGGMTAY